MVHSMQTNYLPEVFQELYLGMSLEEFSQIKEVSTMSVDENEYVTYLTEEIQDKEDIRYFVYQFDKEKHLYEMIIEFKPESDINAYGETLYGTPNQGDEWKIKLQDESLTLKIWRFGNSFCIADNSYFDS